MSTKFAAAINDQGRFANSCVGDFTFLPEANAHVWKGKFATNAVELAEHVNGAVLSLQSWGDPFCSLRVVAFGETAEVVDENKSTPESENEALRQTVRELQETIGTLQRRGPTLRVLEGAGAT